MEGPLFGNHPTAGFLLFGNPQNRFIPNTSLTDIPNPIASIASHRFLPIKGNHVSFPTEKPSPVVFPFIRESPNDPFFNHPLWLPFIREIPHKRLVPKPMSRRFRVPKSAPLNLWDRRGISGPCPWRMRPWRRVSRPSRGAGPPWGCPKAPKAPQDPKFWGAWNQPSGSSSF